MSSARRPRSRRLQVRYFLDCLSRVCLQSPCSFPYCKCLLRCGTVISQSSRPSVVLSILSLPLSLLAPLSRNPASLAHRAPSGLPESVTQLEQQGSSLALTRLLVMTAKQQGSLCQPTTRSHAHSVTHSSGHVSGVHQPAVSFQPERLI